MIKKKILGVVTSVACAASALACLPSMSVGAINYGTPTEDTDSGIIYRLVDEDNNSTWDYAEICGAKDGAKNITIGPNVTVDDQKYTLKSFWPGSFNDSDSTIESITVSSDNSYFSSENNILFDSSKTTIYSCPVGLNISSYDVPSTVVNIAPSAFRYCSRLEKINLMVNNNVLESIGSYAFANCGKLGNVTIPATVNSVGVYAFENTAAFGEQKGPIYYIDKWLIKADKTIETVIKENNEIKSGTVGIADGAFDSCTRLTQVTIPDDVLYIGNNAFNGCSKLSKFSGAAKVKTIGSYAFSGCTTITDFGISDTVTSIGVGAFASCTGLNTVTISKNITEVPLRAFNGCSKLLSVELSEKVANIGEEAFNGCNSLKNITIANKDCEIFDKDSTIGGTADTKITAPKGSKAENYAKIYNRLFNELTSVTPPTPTYPRGDANKDGKTNVRDAAHIARYAAEGKLKDLDIAVADYNNDGSITIRDAAALARDIANGKV